MRMRNKRGVAGIGFGYKDFYELVGVVGKTRLVESECAVSVYEELNGLARLGETCVLRGDAVSRPV
jgi:hypothetical protein